MTNKRLSKIALFTAAAALGAAPVVALPHTAAHAAAPQVHIHRSVHFSGQLRYEDGSVVPQATVYVLPYGAEDTNQAYERFEAYNGAYQTPEAFPIYRQYTIYVECTGPNGEQYSYDEDIRPYANSSYNEYEGTAYMQPDDNGASYDNGGDN